MLQSTSLESEKSTFNQIQSDLAFFKCTSKNIKTKHERSGNVTK